MRGGASVERADPVVVGIDVETERVDEEGPEPARRRAHDVEGRHVADVPRVLRLDAEPASSAIRKMRGSGFITPTSPESITHPTSTPSPGPTWRISSRAATFITRRRSTPPRGSPRCRRSPATRPGRRARPTARARRRRTRCRGDGAPPRDRRPRCRRGSPRTRRRQGLEVGAPAPGPVRVDVDVGRAAHRGPVVRVRRGSSGSIATRARARRLPTTRWCSGRTKIPPESKSIARPVQPRVRRTGRPGIHRSRGLTPRAGASVRRAHWRATRGATMTSFGYTIMSEQAGPKHSCTTPSAPRTPLRLPRRARRYFPWLEEQGHSPYIWSVLGAVADAPPASSS